MTGDATWMALKPLRSEQTEMNWGRAFKISLSRKID